MTDLIQVLWVEDDPQVIESYPLEAENHDLQLVNYPCWDEAKKALEKDYDQWSAIILDAKCKFHRDSADNAIVFLREALKDIATMAAEKHRTIPWFVLSGGAETEIADSINDDRLKWDEDWTQNSNKKYYSKNTDREELFERIRSKASKSPLFQIRIMYKNVFEALKSCGIHDDAKSNMEDLLLPIHFPESDSGKDYNNGYVKARKILEYVIRSMSEWGILPDWGERTNMQWSSCLLSGQDAKRKKDGPIVIKAKKAILPKILSGCLKEMTNAIPTSVHSNEKTDTRTKSNLPEYLPSVDNSPYLLRSYCFQICDVILWYHNYLKEHNNKYENSKNWEKTN